LKISYYNIGCKVNFAETAQIQEQFESSGHQTVKFGEKSDAVIINTCTVTGNADADARKIIRRVQRANPDALISVTGCYAQIKPDEIGNIEGVDAVVGTKQKYYMPKIVEKLKKNGHTQYFVDGLDELEYHGAFTIDNESRTRAVLKMQDGCDYVCTYCTIPLARGKSRSLPMEGLKTQLERLAGSEFYEVVLSGINLGEYLTSKGETFTDAIKLIEQMNLKQRFRISSIEPNLLNDEILEIIKHSDTFCHHFHIPLQSGSPDILRLMKRRYKVTVFENLIQKIKNEIPDCCIGVDVITGFPGETEAHFKETYNLLEMLPVSYLHAFTYSERDFTEAKEFESKVPGDVKKERTIQLRTLSDTKQREFFSSQLGKTKTVIPETYHADTGLWYGWTENYVHTEFEAGSDIAKHPNKVKLMNLNGELVMSELV